jgi:hypothetical protein
LGVVVEIPIETLMAFVMALMFMLGFGAGYLFARATEMLRKKGDCDA